MKNTLLILFFAGLSSFAQEPAPAFEVATVRIAGPDSTNSGGRRIQTLANSLTTRGLSLRACIIWAWSVQPSQIAGPDWLSNVTLDIAAKAPGPVDEKQLYLMLRTLLIERLGLRTHTTEPTEMPVYLLTIGKGGPKFSESATEGQLTTKQGPGGIYMQHVSISDLAAEFSGKIFDRPIVDETGLKGRYDIHLDLASVAAANQQDRMASASAMMTALQEQMGLKVGAGKKTVEVLVIDHAEKTPTEN